MCVSVDETGSDQARWLVDAGLRLVLSIEIRLGAYLHDALSADRDGAVLDDAALPIHGHYVPGADECVDGLGGEQDQEREKANQETMHRRVSGTGLSNE